MTKSNQSRRTRRKHLTPTRNAWKLRSPGIRRLRNTRRVQIPDEPVIRTHTIDRYITNQGLGMNNSAFRKALGDRTKIRQLLQSAGIHTKHISNTNMERGTFKLEALYDYAPKLNEAKTYVDTIKQRYTSFVSTIKNNSLKEELFGFMQRAIAYYNRAYQLDQKFLKASMNEKEYLPIKDDIIDNAEISIVGSQEFLELLDNKNSKAKALVGNNNGEINEY